MEVLYLMQQLAQLQKMIFGSRQERFVAAGTTPSQLSLAIQAETVAACKQYRRIKYAKPAGEGVLIGGLPVRPVETAMAGPGLLAQVVIDKYADHLPLYRQLQHFERSGIKLPYATLADWVSATCTLITTLYEALKAEVLQSVYLHADETPIKVLDNDKSRAEYAMM